MGMVMQGWVDLCLGWVGGRTLTIADPGRGGLTPALAAIRHTSERIHII